MKVSRISPYSGKTYTMDLDITPAQYRAWVEGALIQQVMPELTLDQREFLMTGFLPNEWAALFLEDNEEDDL